MEAIRNDAHLPPENSRPVHLPTAGMRLVSLIASGESSRSFTATMVSARPLAAHAELVREGGEADRIYVLLEGWAGRYRTTRDGRRQIIGLALPGDVANLDSLAFARPGFGVRMLTSGMATSIGREAVRALAASDLEISHAFTRLGLLENAILREWALGLGRKSAEQRLAHLLCELAVRCVGSTEGPVSFELPLTQEQLADVLGLTPVHVNRMLRQLRGAGLVETPGRRMRIVDPDRLRALAEFDPAYLHLEPTCPELQRLRPSGNGVF